MFEGTLYACDSHMIELSHIKHTTDILRVLDCQIIKLWLSRPQQLQVVSLFRRWSSPSLAVV